MSNSPRSPLAYLPPIFRSLEKLDASTLPDVLRVTILRLEGKPVPVTGTTDPFNLRKALEILGDVHPESNIREPLWKWC